MIIISDRFLNLCSWFFKVDGITLWPVIIIREEYKDNRVDINHEKIHLRQQLELLVVGFYLFYAINWVINLILYRDAKKAYRELIFEREAYYKEEWLRYLKHRKFWAWRAYYGQ